MVKRNLTEPFQEFLEKQDMLMQLTESQKLHGIRLSEEHTIDAIQVLDRPNVTHIAEYLKMTKGAISKIVTRLKKAGHIVSYQLPENKKEIYFKLTESGHQLYLDHKERHEEWQRRDEVFLEKYSEKDIDFILGFMNDFNGYLSERIQDIKATKNS